MTEFSMKFLSPHEYIPSQSMTLSKNLDLLQLAQITYDMTDYAHQIILFPKLIQLILLDFSDDSQQTGHCLVKFDDLFDFTRLCLLDIYEMVFEFRYQELAQPWISIIVKILCQKLIQSGRVSGIGFKAGGRELWGFSLKQVEHACEHREPFRIDGLCFKQHLENVFELEEQEKGWIFLIFLNLCNEVVHIFYSYFGKAFELVGFPLWMLKAEMYWECEYQFIFFFFFFRNDLHRSILLYHVSEFLPEVKVYRRNFFALKFGKKGLPIQFVNQTLQTGIRCFSFVWGNNFHPNSHSYITFVWPPATCFKGLEVHIDYLIPSNMLPTLLIICCPISINQLVHLIIQEISLLVDTSNL